jgi:uncharacterized protein Yka (UPF0111/DUF47 family)
MANVENLTEQNVGELQKVFEDMKQGNTDLRYRFYNQDEKTQPDAPNIQSRISALEEKIDALTRKIDLIFGKAVLINGRFVNAG